MVDTSNLNLGNLIQDEKSRILNTTNKLSKAEYETSGTSGIARLAEEDSLELF